ncbi:uncharacterized protein CEXT_353401 [Caerostris extrusa]|uniref:Uncharacterized protein n=1 Tax=Caerostris extrusa TaxID=172846 RepID=A0AAV4YD81_CAEEX|nr:uncharacterized protein CEXT_353401 [Caerostris extrusa]
MSRFLEILVNVEFDYPMWMKNAFNGDTVTREGCLPPEVVVNGTNVPGNGGEDFASVQEVQFLGVIGPLEQKRVCKIKCLNGVWVGPLCTIDQGEDSSIQFYSTKLFLD